MLYLDGGHCGKGNLMRTMRLVKFEIDPGSSLYIVNTTKTKYNVNCAFTNLHIQPLSVTALLRSEMSTTNAFGCQGSF